MAEIVKCDIEDLLHYSATGMLQICCPIPLLEVFANEVDENESKYVTLSIEKKEIKNIPKEGQVYRYRSSYLSIWEFISGEGRNISLDINGLLAISHADISYFYDCYLRSKNVSDFIFIELADFPRDAINPFKTIGYEPRPLIFSGEYCIDLHRYH